MNQRLVLKGFLIAAMTALILVALFAVSSVIDDRQKYRDQATESISESYAGAQTLVGPVLVQPYSLVTQSVVDLGAGKTRTDSELKTTNEITFPAKLTIGGQLVPSERRHGLYRVAVYVWDAHMTASVDVPEASVPAGVAWAEPYLAFELSDVRGIIGMPVVKVNGMPMTMTQGGAMIGGLEQLAAEPAGSGMVPRSSMYLDSEHKVAVRDKQWTPNLRVRLPAAVRGKKAHYDIDVTMQLAGTQRLSLAPVGDLNEIDLRSTWASPLFAGKFLPRVPEVGPQGFHAAWSLSSLAAATQQQIALGDGAVDTLNVSLLTTVDPYKLSDRATKYGILFILLTFGGFFLFEIMKQLPIHPIQYLLVGLGLTIFFLLLISFSEHMEFGSAYLIASAACIGLLTFYLYFVLRSLQRGLIFGGMLTALYAAIYGLLISEDNALVLGSLLLFAILAGVMFVTRKVDWYKGSGPVAPPPAPMPPAISALG